MHRHILSHKKVDLMVDRAKCHNYTSQGKTTALKQYHMVRIEIQIENLLKSNVNFFNMLMCMSPAK